MSSPTSHYVSANGIRLHYLDWGGNGPVCILVHGGAMCGGTWEPIVKRVGDRLHCITPELRDHGDSDKSSGHATMDTLADDFAALYEALDIRHALLIGHSRGGSTAMLSAARCPDRFAGAYLVEPSLLLNLHRANRPDRDRPAQRKTFASRQAMFDAYKGRGRLKRITDESLWALVNYGSRILPDGTVELKYSEPRHPRGLADAQAVESALGRITFPVTLVYSEDSRKTHESPEVQHFCELVGAEFKIVQGTHNTTMEYPDLHAEMILSMAEQLQRDGTLRATSIKSV